MNRLTKNDSLNLHIKSRHMNPSDALGRLVRDYDAKRPQFYTNP